MNDYSQKMEKLEEIKYYFFNEQQYSIGRHNLHGIEWLRNFLLDANFNRNFERPDTMLIYFEIINNLKNASMKYYQIRDNIHMNIDIELLFNPENLFNEIVFNRYKENFWFVKYKEGVELLDAFEYILYVLINYLDNLEFDINHTEVRQKYSNSEDYEEIEDVNENPLLERLETDSLILHCD
jgi:hypothetical protein